VLACTRYETPDLPDLNKKSFSHEEILQKQKEIRKKIKAMEREHHQESRSDA
jgi:hypothetical protein